MNKWQRYGIYAGAVVFLITTIISSIYLVKSIEEKKSLSDALLNAEIKNTTLETELKTAKERVVYKKVYYPAEQGGGLQEESGEKETSVSEAVSKAVEQYSLENTRLTEENSELKKRLELKGGSSNWALGANMNIPVAGAYEFNSARATRKIICILGAEAWLGVGWDFNVKKTQLCTDVKF